MWPLSRSKKKADIDDKKVNDIQWITVKGRHIPIKPGQSKDDAVKQFLKDDDKEPKVSKGPGYDTWKKNQDKQKLSPEEKEKERQKWWAKKEQELKDKRNKDISNIPSTDTPKEIRPSGKNYRVEAQKAVIQDRIANEQAFIDKYGSSQSPEWVKQNQKVVDNLKTKLEKIDDIEKELGLPYIPMKDNTHTKETNGFIHDKTNVKVNPAVLKTPELELLSNRVKSAWNSLPDEHRNLVDNLVIKKSTAKGSTWRGGSWVEETKTLTVNLNTRSSKVEHNFYHEIGHARWGELNRTSPDKIKKFVDTTSKIGIAPTKYAASYRDYKQRNDDSERKYRREMSRRGLTPSERDEKILVSNRKRAETLYNNETHSELNSYVLGFMPREKITATKDTMGKLLKAYKELHEL